MRIAIDARWNYHPGVAVYVSHLIEALPGPASERGIEIVAYESPARPHRYSHPNLRKITVKSGCYSPAAQFELRGRARKDNIDLFHAPFYWIPFLLPCPVLVTIHDLIPFLFPTVGFAHQELVKAGYRASTRFASHVACISERTRTDVLEILGLPPGKVTRVYNFLDTDFFSPASSPGELEYLRERYGIQTPYVMTPSASNWQTKNLAGCLRSIERARDRSPIPFQTVIVGSPIGLEQTGMKAQLRNAVATGMVPFEDLPKLYRNATVFLTLSRYDGFGNPLAEAMACGAASISSKGGSLPEIAGDAAIIYDEDDVEGVAGSIASLLGDAESRRNLSTKGIARARSFSIKAHVENMLNLYKGIAEGNN